MKEVNPGIFRDYDIRGLYPREIDASIAYAVAQSYAKLFRPKEVVLGSDVRLSSPELAKAAERGFCDAGVDVIDIGVVTTDMLYFTVAYYNLPGGITITGSHNPKEYNGIKLVKEKAFPVSSGSGIEELRDLVVSGYKTSAKTRGRVIKKEIKSDYIKHILSYIGRDKIKPFKVVVNPNYGAGGEIIEAIGKKLGIELIKLNFEPNGAFPVPEGRPDPLIPANADKVSQKIREVKADFGVSWDSDADRCFFINESGDLENGYYTTAILADYLLRDGNGGKVVYEPRLTWAIIDYVQKAGGVAILSKAGHANMKKTMIKEDALFGGEMSAHYYFKNSFYVDNGMVPFVLMLEMLSESDKKISQIYAPLHKKYYISGEINFEVKKAEDLFREVEEKYSDAKINKIDGVSVEYNGWRANIRSSNTEPLVRLNIEAHDQATVDSKVEEFKEIIKKYQ